MLFWVRLSLAVSALLFLPQVRESFESPKTAALRVCGFAALGASLATWRSLKRMTWTALDRAVLAWLAVEVLATVFSLAPVLSLVGEPVQREGLFTSVALAGLYLATRLATAERAAAERTLDVALAALAAASLSALAQAARLDPLRWLAPSPYDPIGPGDRPFGTLGHPNLLGLASAAAAAACMARALAGRSRGLHLVGLALFVATTVLTLSRAAWLGLLASLGLAVALVARPSGRARLSPRVLAVSALVLAAVAVPIFASPWSAKVAARVRDLAQSPLAGSGAARIEIWRAAIAAWLARPWLGYGPDTFALVFPRHQTPAYWRFEWGGLAFHAHSIYLHALATRGALGVAAGIAWGLAALAAARHAWGSPEARPLVAACCAMLSALLIAGAFGSLGVTGHLLVVVTSASLAAVAAGPRPAPHASRGSAWVAVGLAVLIAAWSARDLLASHAADAADEGLARARATSGGESAQARLEALDRAKRAVALDRHDDAMPRLLSEASVAMAAVSEDPGRMLGHATEAARQAVDLVPARVENHEQLARALTARAATGDQASRAEAGAEIERMVALAPVNAWVLVSASRLELLLARPERSLVLARRAIDLYPAEASAHVAAAAARVALGDREGARQALTRALAGEWHGDAAARSEAEAMLATLR